MNIDLDRIDDIQQDEENSLNGHEDMLQDEVMDQVDDDAVPTDDSQSDHGTPLNLSHKSAAASVLTPVNNRNVGPPEKPTMQFKKEKEIVVNENVDAEHKENAAY